MSRQYWEKSVNDIRNQGCSKEEENRLVDIFTSTMAKTATTLARKAWFELTDFQTAKGLENFTLTMDRLIREKNHDVWSGTFEAEGKRLEVMGMLQAA